MDIQAMRVGAEVITKMADEAEADESCDTDWYLQLRLQAIVMGGLAEVCERLDTLIKLGVMKQDQP